MIDPIRIRAVNDHPIRPAGDYVLYWMIAQRRGRFNFSLQHAVDRARQWGVPLVVFEPLRVRYRWASDRIHRFVIEGMRDNAAHFNDLPVTYFPYVEPEPGKGTPLLHRLAKRAVTVVTDEYPCFFLPTMIDAVKDRLPAPLETVDANGVVPMRTAGRSFTVAHSYRRWMQKNVFDWLADPPAENPLARADLPVLGDGTVAGGLPESITRRWPAADLGDLLDEGGIGRIPIDHSVGPSATIRGGPFAASDRLRRFLDADLIGYRDDRNHPDEEATTRLSPYLHFGHVAAHEVVAAILDREAWTPDQAASPNGKQTGFWNLSESAEGLLEQLLVWRELGFNFNFHHPDTYDRFESLPHWALATLAEHAGDPRPQVYSLEQFERAETHDELWNVAQRQIVRTGIMHNYMRMLWGKKILHWSATPREALATMEHLNNKYGLDGRDPNSYSGIFWVLGRFDRAWGPKRPIFGSVRYMTSDSTRKKLRLKKYLRRYTADDAESESETLF